MTTSNDTVRGFIENRPVNRNFFSGIFRSTIDASTQILHPADFKGYGIGKSLVFETYTYKEKDGRDFTGFFKVLVRGKLTLLTDGKRYFVLTQKNEVHEITRQINDSSGAKKENRLGFGTLKVLMKDCEKTNEGYLTQNYSDNNLKSIFVTYNECIGNLKFVSKEVKAKMNFNIGLQVMPSIALTNSGYPMNLADMTSSKTLAGGIFFSAFIPGSFQKMRVMLEANYYQYSGYGFVVLQDQNKNTLNNDLFVKYKALLVPLLCRYGDKFFFDVGVQNHLTFNPDVKWRMEAISSGTVTTNYTSAVAPKLWTTGLLFGGGMKFDVASFPVRVFAR